MKRPVILIVFLLVSTILICQEIKLTFTGSGLYNSVETVQAKNLTTNDSIIFPGDKTLILNVSTGIESIPLQSGDIRLYPNPFDNSTTLEFYQESYRKRSISIYNIAGQRISTLNSEFSEGLHTFRIGFRREGIYLIQIHDGEESTVIKAICSRAGSSGDEIVYIGNAGLFSRTNEFKSGSAAYSLDYTEGDILAFRCKNGRHTSIITDSPTESGEYEIEFVDCTDPHDKIYETVKIGEQLWMAENMDYYPMGTPSGSHYQNGEYGILYNWESARCPVGWHLPSDDEWDRLQYVLGGNTGMKLRTTYGWTEGYNGSNESQFSALPAGWVDHEEGLKWVGDRCSFWSGTEYSASLVYKRILNSYSRHGFLPFWQRSTSDKSDALSVRCVSNKTNLVANSIMNIEEDKATLEANLLYYREEDQITSIGACWSTNENPDVGDNYSYFVGGIGRYTSPIIDLEPGTVYYARAFFKVVDRTVYYSNVIKFKTTEAGNLVLDTRDGNTYGYVRLGNQNWLIRNMAYLPQVNGYSTYLDKHYHVYNYSGSSVSTAKNLDSYKKYGVLYNYDAALEACPDGWYLPSDYDWQVLEMYLGMSESDAVSKGVRNSGSVGRKLKSIIGWSEEGNGDNSSGLNMLPAGGMNQYSDTWPFAGLGEFAYYWTSTHSDDGAFTRRLSNFEDGVFRWEWGSDFGFAVRCFQYADDLPVIKTSEIFGVRDTVAFGGGRILYYGNAEILSAGLCWSTDQYPTSNLHCSSDVIESGQFQTHISGLLPGTKYYVRAYVISESGETYGDQLSFHTTDGSFLDPRDSSSYGYVYIGNQTWMANNLSFMPFTGDSVYGEKGEAGYWVYGYNGNDVDSAKMMDEYKVYGTLYNWKAAILACPEGWHLPTDEEWGELEHFLGMDESEIEIIGTRYSGEVGRKLKSLDGWGGIGDNSSRFNALRLGYRYHNGNYYTDPTGFWTSSSDGSSNAWYRGLYYDYNMEGVHRMYRPVSHGCFVRCVKN